MILDTNALSAIAEDDARAVACFLRARQVALPIIVLGEYRYGIALSRHRTRYEVWLQELQPDCRVLNLDDYTASHYASIRVELRKKGRPLPANDIWIAALARQHDLPLMSRDAHFDSVAGLDRIDW